MAESFLRTAAGGSIRVESAGSDPAGHVHPLAIEVMKEKGHDLSGGRSKPLEEFLDEKVDTVITVCSSADEACPAFPGAGRRYHWPFEDPARARGDDADKLECFRRIRDEIERVFTAYGSGRRDARS